MAAGAVELAWKGAKPSRERIDLADIASMPIGREIAEDGGLEMPTNATGMVLCNVPPEWSEGGRCGALRVSGVFVECGTRRLLGAMGSCVYPSVGEGALAVTNGIHAAVAEASGGKAAFTPLHGGSDGAGTITYEWEADGRKIELVVKCFVNERRQMAVCTYIHTKGDPITCNMRKD